MIVPLAQCDPHEQVLPERVDRIAADILQKGMLEDPLIVTRFPGTTNRWLVIDGMHRFAACKKLGLSNVAVHEVEYNNPNILLETWDIITHQSFRPEQNLPSEYALKKHPWANARTVQTQLHQRQILAAIADRNGDLVVVEKVGDGHDVQTVMHVVDAIDKVIDQKQLNPEFFADSESIQRFEAGEGSSIILRPRFTKAEVISQTLLGHIFPYKSTRHIIPNRPLHLNVPLAQLR